MLPNDDILLVASAPDGPERFSEGDDDGQEGFSGRNSRRGIGYPDEDKGPCGEAEPAQEGEEGRQREEEGYSEDVVIFAPV